MCKQEIQNLQARSEKKQERAKETIVATVPTKTYRKTK